MAIANEFDLLKKHFVHSTVHFYIWSNNIFPELMIYNCCSMQHVGFVEDYLRLTKAVERVISAKKVPLQRNLPSIFLSVQVLRQLDVSSLAYLLLTG